MLGVQGPSKRYGQQGVRPPGGMGPYPPMPPHWARYPANASSVNPNIPLVPYPAFYSSAAVHGPLTSPQQTGGAAMQPSSSSSSRPSVVATQFPNIPVYASSFSQQAGGPGLLNPNAAPYYPPATSADEVKNASYNPSSPHSHHQQQQSQQRKVAYPDA